MLLIAILVVLCCVFLWNLRSFSCRDLLGMCWTGVKTTRGILTLFIMLGLLTSLWRACGTIPTIVALASNLIHLESFILITFLLNCGMSVLTGTAIGTAATMGVICASIGRALGMDPAWMGGAILAGAYFGNRISPISSMALLTANITGTDIYKNIGNMLKTTWLPLLASCAVYFAVGFLGCETEMTTLQQSVTQLFSREFSLSLWGLIPAGLIVVLSAFQVPVWRALLASSIFAFIISLLIEGRTVLELFQMLVWGYKSAIPELSKMIDGGGLVSMANVFVIVVLAGCLGGILRGTECLAFLKRKITSLALRTDGFTAMLATAVLTSCVVCNQTLTIILTHQLTEDLNKGEQQALNLYDSAVTVIALVPWSVATAIILSATQSPATSVLCACFLYLLPASRLIKNIRFGFLEHSS